MPTETPVKPGDEKLKLLGTPKPSFMERNTSSLPASAWLLPS
jgi:hypothetical protein